MEIVNVPEARRVVLVLRLLLMKLQNLSDSVTLARNVTQLLCASDFSQVFVSDAAAQACGRGFTTRLSEIQGGTRSSSRLSVFPGKSRTPNSWSGEEGLCAKFPR